MKRIFTCLLTFVILLHTIMPVTASEGEKKLLTTEFAEQQSEGADEAAEADTGTAAVAVETATDLGLTSRAAILMEAETGTVLYEKNADEALSPASITKIMTLILIFDALETGQITLDEEVSTSAYAKSMGGSQVFLEEGERQTVETMIKCIVVASGNDASVAMAEHICGSETEFINRMNERAKELGMTSTHFEDCCGLTDSTTHVSSARDVALMSRELITKYPQIHEYSTIWMENITHVTDKGSSEFGLANTNKLLKQYEWCNGLKTGSTSLAKYCLSATAEKDGIKLIAVIMAAPDYKVRFSEAKSMLQYGYSVCKLYHDENSDILPEVTIQGGVKDNVSIRYEGEFSYLSTDGTDVSQITKELLLDEQHKAPIEEGAVAGKAVYYLNGTEIGSVPLLFNESVEQAGFLDYLKKAFQSFLI